MRCVILCNTMGAGRIYHQMSPNTSVCVLKQVPKIHFLPVSLTVTTTKTQKSDLVKERGKWQHSYQKCSVLSPPAWGLQASLAISTGDNQALLYSQSQISGWGVGLSSPNIQSWLLNLHLSFQKGGEEKRRHKWFFCERKRAATWVCMCASADAKPWVQIWKVLSKAPVSLSHGKHNLALYVRGARCFFVVVERAWRKGQEKSSALMCGKGDWGLHQNHLIQGFLSQMELAVRMPNASWGGMLGLELCCCPEISGLPCSAKWQCLDLGHCSPQMDLQLCYQSRDWFGSYKEEGEAAWQQSSGTSRNLTSLDRAHILLIALATGNRGRLISSQHMKA